VARADGHGVTEWETRQADEVLVRARGGDTAAFAELVRAQQRMVFSLGVRMLADRQKAEDLAQDVFLQLHRKLSSIQSGAHLAPWLRQVTARKAIDRLRREPKHEVELTAAEGCAVEEQDADPLLEQQLRGLLGELSPHARAVIVLRFQDDLDPVDIARALDMSVNTVKSHLQRSLTFLRERATRKNLQASIRPLRAVNATREPT